MSFIDTIINEKSNKYETLIESRVLAKQLNMKIKQYKSTQDAYDKLIQSETVNRQPPSGGWRRIGGALTQISGAGKDYIWGVNSNDAIFKCKKPCSNNNWISPGGSLKQLTGGESEVWGVNSNNDIYKMNQDGTGGWTNIPGKASSVSQGGGYVWVVGDKGNSVWFCKQPCSGNWKLVNNPSEIIIKQLSCSNQYVYGIDTNKHAWWRPINGTDSWKRFGNSNQINWQFYWINATSNKYIYAVDMGRKIYKTDMLGKSNWVRADNSATGVATVSGDPDNSENVYITNTSDAIYVHTPESSGGYWDNIPNENYMSGALSEPKSSNDNWKYLGQGKNIDECKVKAVQDKDNIYSSVVYNTTTDTGGWGQTCYGGVKGGITNPQYQDGIISSLAPNGSSRLGGQEGETLLNKMKQLQTEIKSLIEQSKQDSMGLEKTNDILNTNRKTTNNELSKLLDELARDRKRINKLLLQPDASGAEENSDFLQQSNYFVYFLWILLVIVSLFLASHIIITPSENISSIAYVFVGIWILIFAKFYYSQAKSYLTSALNYLSILTVDPL